MYDDYGKRDTNINLLILRRCKYTVLQRIDNIISSVKETPNKCINDVRIVSVVLEYDYFEHASVRVQVRVLRKQMYSSTSTITLKCTRVRV